MMLDINFDVSPKNETKRTERRIKRCNQKTIAMHCKLIICVFAATITKNCGSNTLFQETAVSAFVAPVSMHQNGRVEVREANVDRQSLFMSSSSTSQTEKVNKIQRGGISKGGAFRVNKELTSSKSATDLLGLFITKGGAKGVAGGEAFNSVNFSTCMHRLAKFSTYVDYSAAKARGEFVSPDAQRRKVLSDPRVAIFIASLSEAIINPKSNKMLTFQNRDFSNIAWAIAKMKLAPPGDIFPMRRTADKISGNNASVVESTDKDLNIELLETAKKVKTQVLEVAKERTAIIDPEQRAKVKNKWIPTLSQLSALLLDKVAMQSLDASDDFKSQEISNLLYALAIAGRADDAFFDIFLNKLVARIRKSGLPKPQEFR